MNDLQRAANAARDAIRTGVVLQDQVRLLCGLAPLLCGLAPEQLRITWSTVAVVDCGDFSLRVSEQWP